MQEENAHYYRTITTSTLALMRSCTQPDDPAKWFYAAITGTSEYIKEHISQFKTFRDRRETSGDVINGMAAIHYAILNGHLDIFSILYEHEYLTVTKSFFTLPVSSKHKFRLGANSSIVHLTILTNNQSFLRHIIQKMQDSDNKELISLQNQYGQTASMLGAILGTPAARLWYKVPLVTLIESFIPDTEGTTFLMAAGLYKRHWMVEQLCTMFFNRQLGDLYRQRIAKLFHATTVEGWTVEDAVTDTVDCERHRIGPKDADECSAQLMNLRRAVEEFERMKSSTPKSSTKTPTTPHVAVTSIPLQVSDPNLLRDGTVIVLRPRAEGRDM